MSYRYSGSFVESAARYKKFLSILMIVFLVVAVFFFYLNLTGVINNIVYYALLISLMIATLLLNYFLGKISKKRYDSTIH